MATGSGLAGVSRAARGAGIRPPADTPLSPRRARTGGRTRRARAAGCAVALCWLLSGCLTPAPNDEIYNAKASSCLGAAVSEVRTAQLAVEAVLDGRATSMYADVVLTNTENAIGPITSSFAAVQPPDTDTADSVRSQTLDLVDEAQKALAQARIAQRRSDRAALNDSVTALEGIGSQMEAAEESLK